MRPLVNELKMLESRGVQLSIGGQIRLFQVFLSDITGGNLFLNAILGFVESLTASHPSGIALYNGKNSVLQLLKLKMH